MQTFRSELFIESNPTKISQNDKILSMGSGFSAMMSNHLSRYGLDITSNPFGKVYNPLSIFYLLEIAGGKVKLDESQTTVYDGHWNHFQFNFLRKQKSPGELIRHIQEQISIMQQVYSKKEFLILSFGTAFVYRHKETKQVVANCHKADRQLFNKELLSTEEIVKAFRHIYPQLNHFKDIILVLSPVMHTKDTITLNAVSKSVLRVAMHEIVSEFPEVKYFPAYEFMLNDLRDYRYYERDFLQPNSIALDYIISKFSEAYFDQELLAGAEEMNEILLKLEQLPYNPQSRDYVFEVNKTISELEQLNGQINTDKVVEELQNRIIQEI